jgi:phosphatidate phosphatase PAH1
MQYVRSTFGSVRNAYNSLNPATLSGAIDVIVVEQEDGSSKLILSKHTRELTHTQDH